MATIAKVKIGEEAHDHDSDSVFTREVDEKASLRIRFIQAIVVTIFLCGLCGAFYFAVRKGENWADEVDNEWNSTKLYSPLFNQFSADGKCITTKKPDNNGKDSLLTSPSFWYQNHKRKEIVHRFDQSTIAYVFENFTFWVTVDKKLNPMKCTEEKDQGYMAYVQRFGLLEMEDRHSEIRRMRDGREVFVYDSYPRNASDTDESTHEFFTGKTLFTQAFVDVKGTLLGWQTYFAPKQASASLRRIDYWYPSMRRAKPPQRVFTQLPAICEP